MILTHRADVVLLTPAGRGAVATILVAGSQATECAQASFRALSGRPLSEQPIGKITLGRWGPPPGEELVVCRRSDQELEVHCHGGAAATAMIIQSLVDAGCRVVKWQDWIGRSHSDPIRAEARLALARARTERTAAILLDQYAGALGEELLCIGQLLNDASRFWEGEAPAEPEPRSRRPAQQELRPPEITQRDVQANKLHQAQERLQRLADYGTIGLHLTQPWRVVLAGRPNVGKSSLINALVGYRRSIVYDQPGTTRDVVTASTALDGWPVELADTAGLGQTDEPIEAAGVERAESQLAAADTVVLVFDASQPWTRSDQGLADRWPDAIRVLNKCDRMASPDADRPPGIWTSALTREGLPELIAMVSSRLVPAAPPPRAAVPFTARHVEAIDRALEMLDRGQPALAAREIEGLAAH